MKRTVCREHKWNTEGEFMKRGDGGHRQLLDLIPNEEDWMSGDSGSGGGGGARGGFGEAEKKLELRLGPPGGEDWSPMEVKKREEPSAPSLGFLNPPNISARSKIMLFLDTMDSRDEGFQ